MASSRRNSVSLASQSLELAITVPEVVAHRMMRLWFAGPFPSRRDRGEFHLMAAEKVAAFHESWSAMSLQMLDANLRLALSPMWALSWIASPERIASRLSAHGRRTAVSVLARGLEPIHRRATANARRLRRVRP